MKISPAKAAAFLNSPNPKIRGVLLFGPDAGLADEYAKAAARWVVEDLSDPFRVTSLDGSTLDASDSAVHDEAAAVPFGGGGRVIFIKNAQEKNASNLERLLGDPPPGESLVVVEAGALGPRSKLRVLFETSENAAAIGCYADEGKNIAHLIAEVFAQYGITVSPDARSYLQDHLGSDRMVSRSELEKLALYKGFEGQVDVDDCLAVVGDSAALTMDQVIYACAGGNQRELDRAVRRAYSEGVSAVALIRTTLRHFHKLHLAKGFVEDGMTVEAAMDQLRPRIIFKFAKAFAAHLRAWSRGGLGRAMTLLQQAEADCKTTGLPAETVCHRALMRLGTMARR